MRKNLIMCLLLMTAMILIPLINMDRGNKTPEVTATTLKKDDGYISVMLNDNGKVEKMEEREYTIGSLAAEMNITNHEESLKAQAVACYTYAEYIKKQGLDEELNGADISDDSAVHQGYLNKTQRKEKWGDKFDEYEKKAEKAVDAVLGKKITYNGEIIMASYHNICSGKTESAKTLWGKEIPYLQAVQSPGDKLSTEYSNTVVLSEKEFSEFANKIEGVEISGKADTWIGKSDKTDSGFVNTIEISGEKVTGKDFRTAFSLKSCNFSIKYSSGKFTIKTLGNGHMVGMSQYGADYMARQGSDYKEILKHYYTDVEII